MNTAYIKLKLGFSSDFPSPVRKSAGSPAPLLTPKPHANHGELDGTSKKATRPSSKGARFSLTLATASAALLAVWLAASPVSAATVGVDIVNFAFQPPSVNIQTGDTVVWTQKDAAPHTSTSDASLWASQLL
jgi:plastocyanin